MKHHFPTARRTKAVRANITPIYEVVDNTSLSTRRPTVLERTIENAPNNADVLPN